MILHQLAYGALGFLAAAATFAGAIEFVLVARRIRG